MATDTLLSVTVVFSPKPREVQEISLQVAQGCTVAQALEASGVMSGISLELRRDITVGVWFRKASPRQVLRDHDRVELYRPLKVDPKVARRERFAGQGAKTTGLFAKLRAGAKAGY
jgi:putative ubiquitin-RnfH superfamily antitoxin RatB of RatAB toxin-antitoxin module